MSRAWGACGGEKKCIQGFSGEIGGENIPLEMLVVNLKKVKCTLVQALRLCTGRTVHRGSRGIGKGKVHLCTGTEALYRLYGP